MGLLSLMNGILLKKNGLSVELSPVVKAKVGPVTASALTQIQASVT